VRARSTGAEERVPLEQLGERAAAMLEALP